MSRTIYKYTLQVTDEQTFDAPEDFRPLAVEPGPDGTILLWAEVVPTPNATVPVWPKTFYVVGTGHPIPEYARHYVGTVQMPPFVWHVYTYDRP